jgi:hypothetical protein
MNELAGFILELLLGQLLLVVVHRLEIVSDGVWMGVAVLFRQTASGFVLDFRPFVGVTVVVKGELAVVVALLVVLHRLKGRRRGHQA